MCEEALKHQGVLGNMILIEEFNCQLFPFEADVVSMEIPEVFRYELINNPYSVTENLYAVMFHSLFNSSKVFPNQKNCMLLLSKHSSYLCCSVKEGCNVANTSNFLLFYFQFLDNSIDMIK